MNRLLYLMFLPIFILSSLSDGQASQKSSLPVKDLDKNNAASVKVTLVPYKVEGNLSYESFWKKVVKNVEQAKAQKSEVVVFPELLTADLVDASEKNVSLKIQFKELAVKHTPRYMEDIKKLAADQKITIVAGSTPRLVGEKIMNTAVFAEPDGRLETQDKVYLTPDEKDWGWASGEKIKIINTKWGRMVILICYDVEIPQISHELASQHPEVLIVPSMTDTIEGFRRVRWTAQARAIEHRSYVVHVGTIGSPDPSWPHWGQASALSPSEKGFSGLLVEGQANSADLVHFDLDLQKLREARAKRGIHPSKDQTDRKLRLKTTVI